jgi:hypothetical protein
MIRAIVHILAGAIGLAIIACVADATIRSTGGYSSDSVRLTIALASGLAGGSAAMGWAWKDGRHMLAISLAVFLFACEAYSLLKIGEVTMAEREKQQAPLVGREQERAAAQKRLEAALAVLAKANDDSPRLARAVKAKQTADDAAVAKAAEKGCAANCREILNQQVSIAEAEVTAARAEIGRSHDRAEASVSAARVALDKIPPIESASPLADRLGWPAWVMDLLAVTLRSVGANGLAAMLVAFAAHGWSHGARKSSATTQAKDDVRTKAMAAPQPAPRQQRKIAGDPASVVADRFAAKAFAPAPDGRVYLREIRAAYHRWCSEQGTTPLSDQEIGAALNDLFSRFGLYAEGRGADAAIVGIGWRNQQGSMLTH